jgi:hypothetical protein
LSHPRIPTGFKSNSPGLRGTSYPGLPAPKFFNPEGVASPPLLAATRGLARSRSLGPYGPSALLNSFRSFPNCSSQSCFHSARSPSVGAGARPPSLQRWAECCNRVAVGRAELPLRLGFGRRSTVALPKSNPTRTANYANHAKGSPSPP